MELLDGEEEGEVAAATHKLQTEETNGISEESDLKEEEINEEDEVEEGGRNR